MDQSNVSELDESVKSLKSLKSFGEGVLRIFCFFLIEAAEGGGGKRGMAAVFPSKL